MSTFSFLRAVPGKLVRVLGQSRREAEHIAPAGLGVGSLPDGISQLPNRTPVALVARDAESEAAWFPTLLSDALAASAVFLVAPTRECVDQLLVNEVLQSAHAQGHLDVWIMTPGLPQQIQKDGLVTFFSELQAAGLQPHHGLYILAAEHLVMGLPLSPLQRLGEQLRVWCLKRKHPVVLCFCVTAPLHGFASPSAPENDWAQEADLLPLLRGMCSMTIPLVTLTGEADRFKIHFERWNAASGAIFQTSFGLEMDAHTQSLIPDGCRTEGRNQFLVDAPDQSAVIATRAAVHEQPGVPQHWQIVDTLEDIAVAASHSIGATVLLDVGSIHDFERRARLVHELRKTRPPSLKIVLRENAGKLRSHREQALLQLGANAVFYREVGFSRLLQLLQDINTQSYTRYVGPDYLLALSAYTPAKERGYQPAPKFLALVHSTLLRTRGIGLVHSMVRLDIRAQTPHVTALQACRVSREGDLVTANRSCLYLFLFACREPDIETALQRLFEVPLAQLFTAQSSDSSALGMKTMLASLEADAREGLPDYSGALVLPEVVTTDVISANDDQKPVDQADGVASQLGGSAAGLQITPFAAVPIAASPSQGKVTGPGMPAFRAQPIKQRKHLGARDQSVA